MLLGIFALIVSVVGPRSVLIVGESKSKCKNESETTRTADQCFNPWHVYYSARNVQKFAKLTLPSPSYTSPIDILLVGITRTLVPYTKYRSV